MSLTRYAPGSLRELWTLSHPLMLQTFAILLMLFVDRAFLSFYSNEAFDASINGGNTAWALLCFFLSISAVSTTVYVSQYKGNHHYRKFGPVIWQMVWFGIATLPFFFLAGHYGPDLIWANDRLEKQYFRWAAYFGSAYVFYGAFSGFFIGQGYTRMVSYLALLTNLINIFLDYTLIFWFDLGVAGAAMATSASMIFQALYLGFQFFKKENREHKGAAEWRLRWRSLKANLHVGAPAAFAESLEMVGWSIFFELMTIEGSAFITVAGIFQSLLLLMIFFLDGLGRGCAVVSGYLIGSGRKVLLTRLLKSSAKLLALFALVQVLIFLFFGKNLIEIFLVHYSGDLLPTLLLSLPFVILYLYLDGLRFSLIGILTGAGDTLFILCASIFSCWFFLLLPSYLVTTYFDAGPFMPILLNLFFVVLATLVLYLRYKLGNWVKLDVSKAHPETPVAHLG